MTEYWQDKRINHRHVACAWALVLVVLAMMLVVTSLGAPECPQWRDAAANACANGKFARAVTMERRP